ncbi:MAG: dihydropteroate synthase [Verrucomicrobia bacterium]|nr:dihydropteroate synthase [Verrucomicrobiota bacterium]
MSFPATSTWLCGDQYVSIQAGKPFLLGILNVTPDSFSDGGKYLSRVEAVRRGIKLLQSAHGLDVGGESTRPGAEPISALEERKRVIPVLREMRKEMPHALLSIDTYKAEVALAAIELAGVDVVNDVGAGNWDVSMWGVMEKSRVGYICMHTLGRPKEMQVNPRYDQVTGEVKEFFATKRGEWEIRKMAPERLVFDVGIGFGKRPEDNRMLLEADWAGLERPLAWGLSRKSFLELTQREKGMQNRDAALDFWNQRLLERGLPMIWRVHDPLRIKEAWRIFSDDVQAMAR